MSVHSSRSTEYLRLRPIVLQRDSYTCVYCGREATEVDHVIPVTSPDFPGDVLTNMVASCKKDNASKGNRTQVRMNWYDNEWIDAL